LVTTTCTATRSHAATEVTCVSTATATAKHTSTYSTATHVDSTTSGSEAKGECSHVLKGWCYICSTLFEV
jgi:hypothetical protein